MPTETTQKHLPQHLWALAARFAINETFIVNNSKLIQLILESKSIAEDTEKQYRFNLLPIMSGEQIEKLNDILQREKTKLAEIEQKYQQKQEEINKRYQETFSSPKYQDQQKEIQQKEESTREQEMSQAEDLLNQF